IGVPLGARGVRILRWYGTPGIGLAKAAVEADAAGPPEGLVERVARRTTPHFHPFDGHLADPFVNGEQHFEIARDLPATAPATAPQREQFFVWWGDLH